MKAAECRAIEFETSRHYAKVAILARVEPSHFVVHIRPSAAARSLAQCGGGSSWPLPVDIEATFELPRHGQSGQLDRPIVDCEHVEIARNCRHVITSRPSTRNAIEDSRIPTLSDLPSLVPPTPHRIRPPSSADAPRRSPPQPWSTTSNSPLRRRRRRREPMQLKRTNLEQMRPMLLPSSLSRHMAPLVRSRLRTLRWEDHRWARRR